MNTDILKEFGEFSDKIKDISPLIIQAITPNVIAAHSKATVWDTSSNNSIKKEVHRNLRAIDFHLSLVVDHMTGIIEGETKEDIYYRLSTIVYAGDTQIHDGSVELWVWQFLQKNIELEKYPNFLKPQFSADGKQIM